jgi:hypothetical protein
MNPKLAKRAIKVMGLEVDFDVTEGSSIRIHDLSMDMGEVAAHIAYWGHVQGTAEEEEIQVDAHYRAWRANAGKALLAKDSKLSEAKVKMLLEADPEFLRHKHAEAEARRITTTAKTMVAAYEAKSRALQSVGARERAELESTGLVTPAKVVERPKKDPSKAADASAPVAERQEDAPSTAADEGAIPAGPKVDKMKSIFTNKRKTAETRN